MTAFFLSILFFFAAHILPAATGLRGFLIAKIGRPLYVGLYSLVSLAAIAWVIMAALAAPYVELWAPGPVTALVALLAMLPACILFVGGALRPNPLSVSFAGGAIDAQRPGLLAVVRHPVLWAFFFWSAGHVVANGDLVALILFGAFALFSLLGMRRLEKRARERLPAADFAAALAVTAGPLPPRLAKLMTPRAVLEVLLGLALYVALLLLHGPVIGAYPLAYF